MPEMQPAANDTIEVKTAPLIPPMTMAFDKQAVQVLLAGLGELPGKIGAPYMVRLEQAWALHEQKHVAAAQAQAEADEALRKKAAEPAPNREQRRAAMRAVPKKKR